MPAVSVAGAAFTVDVASVA